MDAETRQAIADECNQHAARLRALIALPDPFVGELKDNAAELDMLRMYPVTLYNCFREWLHETPQLSLCSTGSDTCDNHELTAAFFNFVRVVFNQAPDEIVKAQKDDLIATTRRYTDLIEQRDSQPQKKRRWWHGR